MSRRSRSATDFAKRVILAVAIGALDANGALAQQARAAGRDSDVIREGAAALIAGPASRFTGSVTVRPIVDPKAPGRATVGAVTFAPGARSNWHTHPAGQTLYVIDGCGWTQHEGGPVERICKGDGVYVAAGVKHWHGATATSAMTHLSITETLDGRNVDWLEPVTDAQYHGPDGK